MGALQVTASKIVTVVGKTEDHSLRSYSPQCSPGDPFEALFQNLDPQMPSLEIVAPRSRVDLGISILNKVPAMLMVSQMWDSPFNPWYSFIHDISFFHSFSLFSYYIFNPHYGISQTVILDALRQNHRECLIKIYIWVLPQTYYIRL